MAVCPSRSKAALDLAILHGYCLFRMPHSPFETSFYGQFWNGTNHLALFMPSDPNFPDEPNFAYLVDRKHGLPCFRIQGKATVVSGGQVHEVPPGGGTSAFFLRAIQS
jgi:hypothetical protein